ncbi:MAG TPA: hypothetical protein VHI51_03240 [Ktedonobacterales bacterium]|nr:hypothetical protein [Ktedonobacterales bacterium]
MYVCAERGASGDCDTQDHRLSVEKSRQSEVLYGFGFTLAQWQVLHDALLQHVVTHEYTSVISLDDGVKYVVEGTLQSPDGRNPQVRSVWMIDGGRSSPRLISAYALD